MPFADAAFRMLLLIGCRRPSSFSGNTSGTSASSSPTRRLVAGSCRSWIEPRSVLALPPRENGNPWAISGKKPGTLLADLQRSWRRIRERAKLDDVQIHDLRHSYASRALALGESLTMIGKLLSHTQVQTTARYAHLAWDSIQNATATITGSIGGNQRPSQTSASLTMRGNDLSTQIRNPR